MLVSRKIWSREIIDLLSKTDILPPFTISGSGPPYMLTMKRYPFDLGDYIDSLGGAKLPEWIGPAVDALIDKLHDVGVLHGDLHAKNIIIDPPNKDARLIDFDRSAFISELDGEDVKLYSQFWNRELGSVGELLAYERVMWKMAYLD